jgi:integrase
LREYWPEYLKAAKLKKKTKSWQTEDGYFKNWIDELLGHIPMREIGLAQWDLLMNAMTDAGLSPRTRQYVALTLRQALDHAFMRKIIPEAPPRAKHVGATLKPDSNRRTRTLTVQELHAILEALNERDQAAYRVTLFCALTCARFGEAAGLEWKDVDLVLGSATFRDTKNGTDRIIPLSQTLVDFLRGLKKEKDEDSERKHGLVFPNGDGGIYRQTPQPFRKVVESLGLNEGRDKRDRVVFHSLRHTGATRLGQANTPLRDMMDLAGWKTPSMALRYQHSGDAGRRRAMAALEGLTQVEPAKVVELFANDKK